MSDSRLPSKATLERAVKAMQIYHGSSGAAVRDQTRLYDRVDEIVLKIALKTGLSHGDVWNQLHDEAEKRGRIWAMPGKHY